MGVNQYLVTLKVYRDCSTLPAFASNTVCYYSYSTAYTGSVTLLSLPGSGSICPPDMCITGNGLPSCSGGTNFGMDEHIYQGMVTLPHAASDWVFSHHDCCRNGLISTVAGTTGYYIYTTLDNLNFPINSSPQFNLPPTVQYCVNVPSVFSLPCTDPDGDSLAYALAVLEDGWGCPPVHFGVTYNSPYSHLYPVSSSVPIVFDSINGTLAFTPDVIQGAVIGMVVREYRNGVLVGELKRDNEILIVNGNMISNHMTGKVYRDLNNNLVQDAGDQPLPGAIIEHQPDLFYTSAGFNGVYSLPCPLGNSTAILPAEYKYYTKTPQSHTALFSAPYQTDSLNDFALYTPSSIQDLRITVTPDNSFIPGHFTRMRVTYTNLGTDTMTGTVNLIYDSSYYYDASSVPPDIDTANTLIWNFSALPPLASVNMDVDFLIEPWVQMNAIISACAWIFPMAGDSVPEDNTDSISELVTAPFDPNCKTVIPTGYISTSQIGGGLYLDYIIYFQNTGTAPAVNVFITDNLDPNFDIPSFEVLSASHPYTWSIAGAGSVVFRFDNINLPDSGSNELLSHGFVRYRIKPEGNLVMGDKMINTAYIYFDNNPAVLTNTTSTTVLNLTMIPEGATGGVDMLVYPNPTVDLLNFEMNLLDKDFVTIQLYNPLGDAVEEIENNYISGNYKKQVSLNSFAPGLYFVKVSTSRKVEIIKVVVQ